MKTKPLKERGGVVKGAAAHSRENEASFRIREILVPIDFSDCSKKALRYAMPLAKLHGAKLTLLNVVAAHPMMNPAAGAGFPDVTSPLRLVGGICRD